MIGPLGGGKSTLTRKCDFSLKTYFKIPKDKAFEMSLELLDNFKLVSYAKRMPHQLSEGQS